MGVLNFFRRNKEEAIQVVGEKCIMESEFEKAIDDMLKAYAKAAKQCKTGDAKEVKRAIVARVSALEELQRTLFGDEVEVC